jgi:hypothetical protein
VAPEIRDHRIVAREPSPPDDDIDRLRLYEAIGRWVASLATRGPALVVLEDLHWADHATLLALRHLLRHPPAAGAMVLMTYRDTEPDPAPATGLASLVADAGHDGHVVHIEVAGLRPGEVVELLRAELGPLDEAGNAFAERLTRRTGGNPLFIHETLRHLGRRGGALGPTTAWPGDRDLNALGVPTGVSRVVDRRLHQLPAPTVTVLREASVIGQEFDLLVLSRMLGIAEMSVLDALQPAVASTLVRPTGRTAAGRADGFAFSHALVRDAVFETLPLADRPPAHWRAGQAIAELRASHRELHVEDIARHLAAGVDAGDTATAVAAGIEAGQRAMAALAFEDAVEWFRTATGLLASTRPVGPGLEFDAWFGLGTAALATGRGADLQRDGYLQAARIARSQHWPDRLARSVIGLTFHSLNADEPAVQGMRQPGGSEIERLGAEALAGLDEKAPERAFLLGMAAVVAVRWGRGHAAHDLAGLAEEVARSVDDPTALGGALLGRCWTMLGGPHPRELARTAERALALADGWETRSLLHTLVLPHVVVAPLLRGDRAGFEAACARVAAHPAVRRSEHLHGYLRMLEAAIALASGRLDEAERSAASISGRDEWWIWHEAAEIQSTAIAGERGRFDHVVSQAGTALAFVPDAATPRVMLTLVGTRSDPARPRLGGEELEDLGRLVHGKLYDQPPNWDSPVLLALTGELAARHEAASLARVVLPKVSEYSGQMLVSFLGTTILGAADRTRGQALLALGRPDEACRHLEAARDLERSLGVEGLVAHSRYWLARAHAAGGRRREASEMAGATLADAEHLGLRTVAEDCRALLRRLA